MMVCSAQKFATPAFTLTAAVRLNALHEAKTDPVLSEAGSTLSESAARHGMNYVDRGFDQVLDELESQADTLLGH